MTILLRLVSLVTFFITTIGDTATQTGDSIGGAREKLDPSLLSSKGNFRRLGSSEGIPADFAALRKAERNSDEALFTHGREFLNALSSGLTHFEIFENKTKNPEMTNLNDLNDMRTSFLYDSHVSYTLLSDPSGYVNLDNQKHLASFGLIHELAESHITHCGHEQTLSHGTFLVGSARGSWMRDLATEHAMAKLMAHLSPSHLKERKDKGLTILRRVVRTEEIEVIRSDITEICSKLFTESVHPMELFSQMKLETISKSPFQYAQMRKNESLEKEHPQRSRNGMSNMQLQPDSPIITCDPNNYSFGGKGGGYSVGYSLTEGCAEYYSDFTAYSFNYDLKTGSAASPTITLAPGVTCQDCYAYLGASLLVIVEYRFGYFGFEIKGGGALGIKAAIDILDPTISGSFTIKILEESNKYSSVYLGYAGLYLGYTFGGLTATLSGSGTFSGAASFSTARSAEGSLGLLLVSTGYPTFPASFNEKYSPPVFSAKSFKLKSFSLAVELTGTEKFYISMFNLVFFYFSSSISGSVSVAVAMATSASVSISSTPKTSLSLQNIHQSESIPSFESYIPGEIITIKFDYFGFNPSENTTIFYSIEKSNMSHPIMQRYFISSTTGSGTFVTDWIVPWDYSLAGVGPDNTQIIVKASNMIFDIYKSPSFSTSLFTEYDGIFTSPNIAEIVPTDTPYLLKWNRDLLTSFQQNYWDSDLGADVFARNVLIVLHAEKMSPNGSIILSKSSYHNLTVSAVPNIGQCTVTFPSTLNDIGDRFYLVVESLLNNDIRGWSKNYFTLAPGITNSGKLSLQNLNNVFNKLTMSKNLLTTIGEFRDGESIKAASCGGTTMTSGFKSGMASGTLDILTFRVYSTPHSTSTSVYSPGALCIELPTGSPSQRPTSAPTTASPTLTPTSAPTTYAPSSVFSAGIQALSNSSNSPNSSIIGIAVGVGGGVLLLVLIASIVYCCRRKAVPGTSGDQRNNDINDQIIIGAP